VEKTIEGNSGLEIGVMDVIYGQNKQRDKLNSQLDKPQNLHFGCLLRISSNILSLLQSIM
jgi:hypothetical protein